MVRALQNFNRNYLYKFFDSYVVYTVYVHIPNPSHCIVNFFHRNGRMGKFVMSMVLLKLTQYLLISIVKAADRLYILKVMGHVLIEESNRYSLFDRNFLWHSSPTQMPTRNFRTVPYFFMHSWDTLFYKSFQFIELWGCWNIEQMWSLIPVSLVNY